MRQLVAKVLLACALLVGGIQAPATAIEAADPAAMMQRAHAERGAAAAGLFVERDRDGVHVQRQLPEGARGDRPQLMLGDPRRLLDGTFGTADQAPLRPATPALAALAGQLGLLPTGDDSSTEPEVEGDSLQPGAANTETYRWAYPLADLSGDGVQDLAVGTYIYGPEDSSSLLEVRDGRDGTVLWTDTSDAWALGAMGDVDGDGTEELLRRTVTVTNATGEYGCDDEGNCHETYTEDLQFEIAVVDGPTGAVRWAQTHSGRYEFTYEETSDETSSHWEVTEAFSGSHASAAGDHDGDGLADLVVNDTSYTYSVSWDDSEDPTGLALVTESSSSEDLTGHSVGSVVRGSDGQELLELDAASLAALSSDIGDVTGDGIAELRWTRLEATSGERSCTTIVVLPESCETDTTATYNLVVELRDGVTGAPRWSAAPVSNPFWDFTIGDLDGDGADDVMVLGAGAESYATTAISGATGSVLWSKEDVDWLFPITGPDLDGDGDTDALVILFESDFETFTLHLRRIDGRTGDTWLETTPFGTTTLAGDCGGFFYAAVYGRGIDADSDGVADPLAEIMSEGYSGEDCDEPVNRGSKTAVESASSGRVLYSEVSDELIEIYPVSDLDGDGATDINRFDWVAQTTSATSGLTGPQLWSVDGYVQTLDHDLDGVPGTDVARYHVAEDSHDCAYEEVLDILSGLDLHRLWGVGGMNP